MSRLLWKWKDLIKTRYYYSQLTTEEEEIKDLSAENLSLKATERSKISVRKFKVAAGIAALMVVFVIYYLTTTGEVNHHELEDLMQKLNTENAAWLNRQAQAEWDYASDLTESNLQKKAKVEMAYSKWTKEKWNMLRSYDWKSLKDTSLKRQFQFYSTLGQSALPECKEKKLDETLSKMEQIYSTTKLRQFNSSFGDRNTLNIQIQPELLNIFTAHNKTSCELAYYWEGWHSSVGRREKQLFQEYVNLSNEAAQLNNLTDMAEQWISVYEMNDFELHINKLYLQILPLYKQLHAYVRNKLLRKYNMREHITIWENGSIPAHILGNIWAQQWPNIYDSTMPYPNKSSVDISSRMIAQNYTVMKMFKFSEEFFVSLNLSAMTKTFWQKSIFEKPKNKEIVCHGSSWDFHDGEDYRIKMCTTISYDMFKTIHHEMGHIQYFQQYKDQPVIFQDGANPGFHEAVGDTLALSVANPQHLKKIGLLDPKTYVEDQEADINSLYLMALDKVAFLPYAYTLERWRWEVFRKNVTPSQYNCRFWELRQELGGIVPPVERSSEDFDPGAKYHVIADTPYIRYFISHIIQFQFHKALCIKAGHYDPDDPMSKPLHKCDIYQSPEAGNILRSMLQLGSSKPWKDAMEMLTGQREMDAGPLLEYFQPLLEWLRQENIKNRQSAGWTIDPKMNGCSRKSDTKSAHSPCRYEFDHSFDNELEKENL